MPVEPINSDELSIASDNFLFSKSDMLRHLYNVFTRKQKCTKDLEIEICWVQRELRIRENRKKKHDIFKSRRR
jgi:hypothetical protein